MKFHFIISKLHNQLFFISNLAEWSPYCRRTYNELWLKNKRLAPAEKEALQRLAGVLRKHPELPKLYTDGSAEKVWECLRGVMNRREFEILQTAHLVFMPRFEKIWRVAEPNLRQIREKLSKSLTFSQIVIKTLGILYGKPKNFSTIKIFLLASPIATRAVSGGGGLGTGKIKIECSKINKTNNEKSLATRVILHELIHVVFEKRVRTKIKQYLTIPEFAKRYRRSLVHSAVYKQTQSFESVIKELIAVSLLPEGYLAEKFFGLNVIANLRKRRSVREKKLAKNYYDLMLFAVFALYGVAKQYTEQKRPIDKQFIKQVVAAWAEFELMDLSELEFKKARNP